MHSRPQWDNLRGYHEPRYEPDIGRRPLDLGLQHGMPAPPWLEAPPNEDYYSALRETRPLAYLGPPGQHRLTKLDVFTGKTGEQLDDFMYQVEGVCCIPCVGACEDLSSG